ncbi:MAG TPA: hypothetical protein VF384_00465 [Planctomycetota bacterium]
MTLGTFTGQGTVPTGLQPSGTAAEISGIVASRHNPGVLWVHDDSANAAQLIALRSNGALARQYSLAGVANRDWEDIAIGPGPIAGRDYLYIADTGNNALGYTTFYLLRTPEPDVPIGSGPMLPLPAPDVFPFHYPTGTWNAETLWIDPADGSPYVLTKVNSSTCRLFRYPLPLDASADKALVLVATLTNMPVLFTGGAISADGRWIFARTNSSILAWPRPAGTAFAAAFGGTPCTFAAAQGQAEAIAVAADGASIWAVSEGSGATLWRAPAGWPNGAPVWYAFGSGLAGGPGVPALGATAAPRLGGPGFDVAAWQLPPGGDGVFLVSLSGFDDGQAPWMGGWLHAGVDLVIALTASAGGTATFGLPPLPDVAAFYGLPIHAQVITIDALAPQGYALSRGLRLRLDR